jgi:hypothetical protein
VHIGDSERGQSTAQALGYCAKSARDWFRDGKHRGTSGLGMLVRAVLEIGGECQRRNQELRLPVAPGSKNADIVYKADLAYRHVGSPPKPGGTQELEQHSPGTEQAAPEGLHA